MPVLTLKIFRKNLTCYTYRKQQFSPCPSDKSQTACKAGYPLQKQVFPNEQFKKILDYITRNHKLVLSSFIIDELTAVVVRKFPKKRYAVDSFLSDLSYELVYTPRHMPGNLFNIRVINDYPVLYTAIIENIDSFITGDKDFLGVDVEMPEIMTPGEFLERHI